MPVYANLPRLFSPPLRFACLGALGLVLLQAATPIHAWLEYRLESLASQPWRVLTAHLVHLNWTHVWVNALGWLLIAHLFAPELNARRQTLVWAVSGLCISVMLALMWPSIRIYRGFSGTLHALYFSGAIAWGLSARRPGHTAKYAATIPWVLYAFGLAKVLLEQPWDATTPYAAWLGVAIAPQVHLVGAVTGTVLGVWFALAAMRPNARNKTSH